jgi:hypothetical protein
MSILISFLNLLLYIAIIIFIAFVIMWVIQSFMGWSIDANRRPWADQMSAARRPFQARPSKKRSGAWQKRISFVTGEARERLRHVSVATLCTQLFKRGFRNVYLQGVGRLTKPSGGNLVGAKRDCPLHTRTGLRDVVISRATQGRIDHEAGQANTTDRRCCACAVHHESSRIHVVGRGTGCGTDLAGIHGGGIRGARAGFVPPGSGVGAGEAASVPGYARRTRQGS